MLGALASVGAFRVGASLGPTHAAGSTTLTRGSALDRSYDLAAGGPSMRLLAFHRYDPTTQL